MPNIKKPMLYLTWDATGMRLWAGRNPPVLAETHGQLRYQGDGVCSGPLLLPVSWYGGIVDFGERATYDPETVLDRRNAKSTKIPERFDFEE